MQCLAALLKRHRPLERVPQGVMKKGRTDEAVSAVSAAYWHAARTMSVHDLLADSDRYESLCLRDLLDIGWGPWFSGRLPKHSEAMEEVIRGMVYTLFALCLIRAARIRYGLQIPWNKAPASYQFVPPWRLCPWPRRTDRFDFQVRARADKRFVLRLVSRYRAHVLFRVPDGVSRLELIRLCS